MKYTKIFIILFLTTLILSIYLILWINRKPSLILYGTYSTGNNAQSEYLVFEQDDTFHLYKQFNSIMQGQYRIDENRVVELITDNGVYFAVYANDNLYYFDSNRNNVLIFTKIEDVPTYINIRD